MLLFAEIGVAIGTVFGVLFVVATIYVIGITIRGEPRVCPHCAEAVRKDAKVCKHCHRDLPVAGS